MYTRGASFFLFPLAAACVLLLAACSTAPTQPVSGAPAQVPSGFLQDYSVLRADADTPGYQSYTAPGLDMRQYRSFLIEAPVFMINTQGAYEALTPSRLQEISDYTTRQLSTALSQHYKVVQAPGPGVARLRIAVVGLLEVSPQFRVTDLVPAKALFNVARMAADQTPHALQMSIESEARDSQSNRLLGAVVDRRQSQETVAGRTTAPSDAQIHDLIDYWVARFVARLDRANGYAVPSTN